MPKQARKRWFLREYRKARGWTQEELAEHSGVQRSQISELENGAERYNQDVLEALARALSTPEEPVTPGDLLDRDPRLKNVPSYWSRRLARMPEADRAHVERMIGGVMDTYAPSFDPENKPIKPTKPKRKRK